MSTVMSNNEYWMLCDLLLNEGYDKQQLAHYLHTTPSKIDEILKLSMEPPQSDKLLSIKLKRLHTNRSRY